MKRIIMCILLIPAIVYSYRAGQILRLHPGTAGNSLGEAYVSVFGTLKSVSWNPAALAGNKYGEFYSYYSTYFADTSILSFGIGYPLSLNYPVLSNFSIGATYTRLSYGDFEFVNVSGNSFSVYEKDMTISDVLVSIILSSYLSLNNKRTGDLLVGISSKYLAENLGIKKSYTFTLDIGIIYPHLKLFKRDFSIGLTYQNIGGNLKFYDQEYLLPSVFRFGISSLIVKLGKAHIFNGLLGFSIDSDGGFAGNIGLEYQYQRNIYFRIGKVLSGDENSIFSAGAEIDFSKGKRVKVVSPSFGYSYKLNKELGGTHSVEVIIKFK